MPATAERMTMGDSERDGGGDDWRDGGDDWRDGGDDWREMLANPETHGERLREWAARPDAAVEGLAALASDGARLKATPAIAAAIYANRRAPLSVANQAVVTCLRIGVVAEAIPAFVELAVEIAADPSAVDGAAVDAGFAQLVAAPPDSSADGQDSEGEGEGEGKGEATKPATATGTKLGRKSAIIDFSRLKLYEKIRLATLGNSYCRQNLLRDSNRMVAMAVIRSPQITDSEIAKAAGNRALSEEVIRYIANRKELVKQYPIKLALVGNAKCPLAVALRLLPTLNADDIKQFSRSKNIPGAVAVAAKRLAAPKAPQ